MTIRPNDYGDHHPSDNDDLFPTDKTATFQETDYRINDQATARPPSNLITGQPELIPPEGDEVKSPVRVAFTGIITKIEQENGTNTAYWVLRQDFKRGRAFLFGNEAPEYSDLRVGDEVELTAGEIQGQWRIVGAVKQKLIPTLTKRCTLDPTDGEGYFQFNDTVQSTDFDTLFIQESEDTIRINCQEQIQLDLLFKAIITSTKPKTLSQISIITDIRLGNGIEVNLGTIEGVWLKEPTWVTKIPTTSCQSY